MTIGKGNDRIDLYYFGRGHTNGDAWTVFPALRVMHAGDIFSGKRADPGREQRRQRSRGAGYAREGRAGQGYRRDHHRPQHGHDARRPEGVPGLQSRFPELRARGEEGREVGRRGGRQLEEPGQVHRISAAPA